MRPAFKFFDSLDVANSSESVTSQLSSASFRNVLVAVEAFSSARAVSSVSTAGVDPVRRRTSAGGVRPEWSQI